MLCNERFSTHPPFHSQDDSVEMACISRSRVLPFTHHTIPRSVALSIHSSPLPNPSQRAGCQAEAASDCSITVSPNRQAEIMCSNRLWWTKWTAPAWFGSVARIAHGTIGSLGSGSPGLAPAGWLRFFRLKRSSYSFFPCHSMYPTSDQRSNISISTFGQLKSRTMWRSSPILRVRRSGCFLGFSVFSWKSSSLRWALLASPCLDPDRVDIAARRWLFLFENEDTRTERRVDERIPCLEDRESLHRRYLRADCRSRYRVSCSFAFSSSSIHSSFSASLPQSSHWCTTDRWDSTRSIHAIHQIIRSV